MKKITLFFGLFLFSFNIFAQQVVSKESDKKQIVALLSDARKMPENTNWVMHFARKFFDVPYVGGTLDKDTEERLVVNLRELDCTTYVETVLSLAICAKNRETTFDDYCRHLRDVRYIDGKVAYVNRQHYFTIWIDDNVKQGLVYEISNDKTLFTGKQKLHIDWMTKHVSSYKMLSVHSEWLPGISKMENSMNGKVYPYIPKALLKPTKSNNEKLQKCIKDGDIIAILTNKKGLDTTHIGIASWHKDGLHLINASSIHKKVVDEPMTFYDYMQQHPSQIGIRVVRIK